MLNTIKQFSAQLASTINSTVNHSISTYKQACDELSSFQMAAPKQFAKHLPTLISVF
jgi:hypothetical protein